MQACRSKQFFAREPNGTNWFKFETKWIALR
jgi:hypothetical protein